MPNTALVDGMAVVGEYFRDSILYMPDALRAAKAVKTRVAARVEEGVGEVARAHARQILAEHWPVAIPAEVDADIRCRFEILLPESVMVQGGESG